jgi:hypothetical protein
MYRLYNWTAGKDVRIKPVGFLRQLDFYIKIGSHVPLDILSKPLKCLDP